MLCLSDMSDGETPGPVREASESEEEDNVSVVGGSQTTSDLVEKARRAGNIETRNADKENSRVVDNQRSQSSQKRPVTVVDLTEGTNVRSSRPRLLLSKTIPKSDRPDWLMEDDDIDSLPPATVLNVVSQLKMTRALERQNELREEKAVKSKGGLKIDQEVKRLKVEEGVDNATTMLHSKRFMFRTPLLKPEDYWASFPVKWPEVNKKVHLAHLGLDHVISAKTLEAIHDRSDPTVTIKMFSNVNVMMGREGVQKTSRVQQRGNYVEVESMDNWLEVANISQLEEAMDNLVRVWTALWPGEYGPANLRGVISKHKSFATCFDNVDTRKKVLEDFINRILSDNAVRAGQKLPPLSFKEVDDRAKDLIDRKSDYTRGHNRNQNSQNQNNLSQNNRSLNTRNNRQQNQKPGSGDFAVLRTTLSRIQGGLEICVWFNLKEGCQIPKCNRKHVCANLLSVKKELCKENHSMVHCKRK